MPDLLSLPRAPDGIQAPVVISPLCLLLQPACLFLLQWLVSETSGGLHAAHTTCQTPCRQWHRSHLSSSPPKSGTTQKSPGIARQIAVPNTTAVENAKGFLSSAQCFCRCSLVSMLILKCFVINNDWER